MSPTQRTLDRLRRSGLRADVVERWIRNPKHPAGGVRRDLFGIVDIIALDPNRGVVGIQSTGLDYSGHYVELVTDKRAAVRDWLSVPGAAFELWGWKRRKVKRGGSAFRWEPRRFVFTKEMVREL